MTTPDKSASAAQQFWTLGDYARITELLSDLGQDLVAAAGIRAGQRVLDVGAGTGNATLPAARAGAEVTATDVTPRLMEIGARVAQAENLQIHWVEGDAQALPFDDGEFDVVLSCIGAMFAPDHAVTARELLRVCRPGGRLAMANWPPGGAVGHFFKVLAKHTPPPPSGAHPPAAWGDPKHVARLLGAGCADLVTATRAVTARFDQSPEQLIALYKAHFAPVIAAYAGIAGDAERTAALDADLLAFARAADSGPEGGPNRYVFEYLQVIGSRATR
ncbi:class I SAM-dependent methyltransferase [Saccharopolyspora pogona]|uniref:class I SAM-dependent methyltransferase n=1 Tax=Saccharopolyspora pogona TaxID=333966 RepID=UPI0016827B91|nr:class I SAM-dependent methyltransferase [Saccharopolyspora pogona]